MHAHLPDEACSWIGQARRLTKRTYGGCSALGNIHSLLRPSSVARLHRLPIVPKSQRLPPARDLRLSPPSRDAL